MSRVVGMNSYSVDLKTKKARKARSQHSTKFVESRSMYTDTGQTTQRQGSLQREGSQKMAPESTQGVGDFIFGNGVSPLSSLTGLGSGKGLYEPNTGKPIGFHHRSSPVGDLKV